jgi:hypothetical protein
LTIKFCQSKKSAFVSCAAFNCQRSNLSLPQPGDVLQCWFPRQENWWS